MEHKARYQVTGKGRGGFCPSAPERACCGETREDVPRRGDAVKPRKKQNGVGDSTGWVFHGHGMGKENAKARRAVAEQFLTLMADLDEGSQTRMAGWYRTLREAGFTGIQPPGLPYHISLASYPLDQEKAAVETLRKAAAEFGPVPVHISHIGMFAGGRILFGAQEKDAGRSLFGNA